MNKEEYILNLKKKDADIEALNKLLSELSVKIQSIRHFCEVVLST